MTGGTPEATGTPQLAGEWSDGAPLAPGDAPAAPDSPAGPAAARSEPGSGTIDGTRFAHASEAEMARILDFYAVRWEYEPTTFPILWNLEGEVVESFAPDFYLPELELFLEMTTLKQRLVRKKNRKLRRLRELYPDIRIKLFYARDFRAMMLKYGRLALAEALSGTPGQMGTERSLGATVALDVEGPLEVATDAGDDAASRPSPIEPAGDMPATSAVVRAEPPARPRRRRRCQPSTTAARAEQEAGG